MAQDLDSEVEVFTVLEGTVQILLNGLNHNKHHGIMVIYFSGTLQYQYQCTPYNILLLTTVK